ncbi:MAG: hypothetical protein HYY01_06980 [Chloroflexi bacterium]|nr:hypothetical protein [Chloroflexota bacterium]
MAIDDPSGANEFRFYVGLDLDPATGPASWTEKITFKPSDLGNNHQGGGVALADINGNGKLDLLLMAIDDPSGRNEFRYYVGWDLDTAGPSKWSDKVAFSPTDIGNNHNGGGVALADINGNGKLDLLLMAIDDPSGANEFRYYVGWDFKAKIPSSRVPTSLTISENCYEAKNSTAVDFNARKCKASFEIENTSEVGAEDLGWSATLEPGVDWLELSKTDGILRAGSKATVTVKAQPPDAGSVTKKITLAVGTKKVDLQVTINAWPLPPAPSRVAPALGSNSRVNVAADQKVRFEVSTAFSGQNFNDYKWVTPDRTVTRAKNSDSTNGVADLTFSQTGNTQAKVLIVDNNKVEGYELSIPVAVWKLPTVDEKGSGASWKDGKYVGVVGQEVTLKATGQTGSTGQGESITQFLWDLDNDWATVEKTQPAGQSVTYTWAKPTLTGRARVKAETNYGIVSDERLFDVKVYDTVQVDAGGPYGGRPLKEVALKGSYNQTAFPGGTVVYKWQVLDGSWEEVATDSMGAAKYTWSAAAAYQAKFTATVTTTEGLVLSDNKTTDVVIEAGKPTAMPGGPYQGGIAGGNFSPVQFSGNPPDFIEADDVGKIVEWQWFFSDGSNKALELDGVNDYVDLGSPSALQTTGSQSIELWLKPKKLGTAQNIYLQSRTGKGAIVLESDGKVTYYYGNSSGITMDSALEVNTWTHLAIVRDLGSNKLRWYKNGVLVKEAASSGVAPGGSQNAYIGKGDGSASPYLGSIDDLAIWDHALSEGQVQDHMVKGLKGTEQGLVGLWSFEDGQGNTVKDSSSSKNNGTLGNMAATGWVDGHTAYQRGVWNPTYAYPKAGRYETTLMVKSEHDKWSTRRTAAVQVVDGTIAGYVKAADLRTPVRDVRLTLTSDHVGQGVLRSIAGATSFLAGASDTSDANFAIASSETAPATSTAVGPDLLTITSPNGGEKWAIGSTQTIRWSSSKLGQGTVKIEVSRDGGVSWVTIERMTPNDGEFQWTVAGPSTDKGKVRISEDPKLQEEVDQTGKLSIWTLSNAAGYYAFEHLPLGTYRVLAYKKNADLHEFEKPLQVTELTLKAPNQLAIDFVDISVFPVGGRVLYSKQKNGADVLVDEVSVEAFPIGSVGGVKSLPSASDLTNGMNWSVPLFAGKYLFVASRSGHDVRIKGSTPGWDPVPGYNPDTGLVTIKDARTDVDFIDLTTRKLTVYVVDSGGYPMPGKDVIISGLNGEAGDLSDAAGKFEVTLNPGKYTVTVPGGMPKGERVEKSAEVDLTTGDMAQTMVIPVKIVLEISPKPNLLGSNGEAQKFLKDMGLKPEQIEAVKTQLDGYMYYWPPEPRTHTYTIVAKANGHPVQEFALVVTDEVSQMTPDPPAQQEPIVSAGDRVQYAITAGLPKLDRSVTPPLADPKWVHFLATKDGYKDSALYKENVTILGDVPVGSAARLVSVPTVNYGVLHDPPGDGSYAYLDDSMTFKGIVRDMKIVINDREVMVYPSPWTSERSIDGFKKKEVSQDLGTKGLLGNRESASAGTVFLPFFLAEVGTGVATALTGAAGFAVELAKIGLIAKALSTEFGVQYEVSANRRYQTPSGDSLPDVLGPGKGDIYFGEGWTLGLQTKYRLGIKWDGTKVVPDTQQIETYDILERTNQYVYTVRDIEKIVTDLERAIAQATDEEEKKKLEAAKKTWTGLLNNNLARQWLVEGYSSYLSRGKGLDDFLKDNNLLDEKGAGGETLMVSGGAKFEYSRRIYEGSLVGVSADFGSSLSAYAQLELDFSCCKVFGAGTSLDLKFGGVFSMANGVSLRKGFESGKETEQTAGFVLSDDDVGDSIVTRVFTDPTWGTPLFFTEPGSVSSDPWEWQQDAESGTKWGTNRAVDLELTLETPATGVFDYSEGAHYKIRAQFSGQRVLQGGGTTDFLIYALTAQNPDNVTTKFNGDPGLYRVKFDPVGLPVATIAIDVYPPERDKSRQDQKQYQVTIVIEEEMDQHINRVLVLNPAFADLKAPRAVISTPYEGQRISPVYFPEGKAFEILAVSEAADLASIQLQIRSKRPDGVWEPWSNLSGMLWQDGVENPSVVTVFDRLDRRPPRREFTFKWPDSAISPLGEAEYALRAIAIDRATPRPNTDIDPPYVTFRVDGTKPSALNTVPDYQAKEGERVYASELSATFTDDMRPGDFTDRTFYVTDLLNNNAQVAGYVSYNPALRKAVFVPIVPFKANGFYRVAVKTDTVKADGTIDQGVHDLAGNPLDITMMWTFRTKGLAVEPSWSIELTATDGIAADAGNVAGVEFGASDTQDEKDVREVVFLPNRLRLSFLDRQGVTYDRDIRPADGRLSHHWSLAVKSAATSQEVTILWRPSAYLVKAGREYQVLRLVEFDSSGSITNTIPLDPTRAELDLTTGLYKPLDAYTYTPALNETRYFRLDVQKSEPVVGDFKKGTSGWVFFSVPITPQVADPFVNLGDDIDPLKLYWYDTASSSFKVYPPDLGEVSLQPGRGYFTFLEKDAVVDIGGAVNQEDVTVTLGAAGLHAIGNPFLLPVSIQDLKVNGLSFDQAVAQGLVSGTLYRWKLSVAPGLTADREEALTTGALQPWKGYWLETKAPDIKLTFPVPSDGSLLLDNEPPRSKVISATANSPTVTVKWSGQDDTSGVKWYDIQYKDGARGAWSNWLAGTTSTSAVFPGGYGHTWYFRSRAQDYAGNWEEYTQGDGHVSVTPTPGDGNGASSAGPTLMVTTPNGGEAWATGSLAIIAWSSPDSKGLVRIEFSRNGGQTWGTLVSRTANDGAYTWTVRGPATGQALVRVTNLSTRDSDTSDASFTIAASGQAASTSQGATNNTAVSSGPAITVTSPNGGETWTARSKATITWSSHDSKGLVRIELSRDGGATWQTIVSRTRNDGSHTWRVRGPATTLALVRVTHLSTRESDTSDASFTIAG